MNDLEQLTTLFRPITLEEMKSVKLMNRIDTKFVTTIDMLKRLLVMAKDDYRMQQTDGERNLEYHTTYFDTPDLNMFRVHQCGHTNRQKLRFRTYVSSNLQFMEVKTKNNHGRTKKKRMAVGDMMLDDEAKLAFLSTHLHYEPQELAPALTNRFRRITLVNAAMTERLTLDSGLWFHNERTGQERTMGELVVVEVKRDGLCPSPAFDMLRELRIHPHGFSKYCMGTALTNPEPPSNRLKPKLRDVEKIIHETLL